MPVQEKNLLKGPQSNPVISESCQELIPDIDKQLFSVTQKSKDSINSIHHFQAKQETTETILNIGSIISPMLLSQLHELGQINHCQIANSCEITPYTRVKVCRKLTTAKQKGASAGAFYSFYGCSMFSFSFESFLRKTHRKRKKENGCSHGFHTQNYHHYQC